MGAQCESRSTDQYTNDEQPCLCQHRQQQFSFSRQRRIRVPPSHRHGMVPTRRSWYPIQERIRLPRRQPFFGRQSHCLCREDEIQCVLPTGREGTRYLCVCKTSRWIMEPSHSYRARDQFSRGRVFTIPLGGQSHLVLCV